MLNPPPAGVETAPFVCVHNSARSQMAEAFANRLGKGRIQAYSVGVERGRMNPNVVEVMREIGYDLANNSTKSLFDREFETFAAAHPFDYVVTVCDESAAERCPVYPSKGKQLHWNFPDPSAFTGGSQEAILALVRDVRDAIREKVTAWVSTLPRK